MWRCQYVIIIIIFHLQNEKQEGGKLVARIMAEIFRKVRYVNRGIIAFIKFQMYILTKLIFLDRGIIWRSRSKWGAKKIP